MRIIYCLCAFLSLLIGANARCLELDPALEKEAKLIFSEVFSPYCAGRLLQDCPSSDAIVLKNNIREMLHNGKAKEEVINHLTNVYGTEILAQPKLQGFAALAWFVPIGFLIIGFVVLFLWLRKNRNSAAAEA